MSKIKMGVVGCGAIAQVQHMPNLGILHALYEVTWVCDISPGLARWLAEVFGVPNYTTDPHELLRCAGCGCGDFVSCGSEDGIGGGGFCGGQACVY